MTDFSWYRSLSPWSGPALEGRPLGIGSAVRRSLWCAVSPAPGPAVVSNCCEDPTRVGRVHLQYCLFLQLRPHPPCSQQNRACFGGMLRSDLSVRVHSEHVDDFPQTRSVVHDLRSGKPTCGFSGNLLVHLRRQWVQLLGVAVGDWEPNPFSRLWLQFGAPSGILEEVESHCAAVTSSQGTQLLSTRVSHAGHEPEIVNKLLHAQRAWATACSSTPSTNSRATGAWAMLCCPSWPSSPSSNRMEVRSTGPSWIFFVQTSAPLWPSLSGLNCQACDGAVEWLTVDVAHAVYNMPIRPSERQFLCGKVDNRFLVFKVFGMGGKSSPNFLCRKAAALVAWFHRSSAATSFVARST